MFNTLVINPAYAGSRGVNSAMIYYRHQWADIETAPRDISFSIHGPFRPKVGLGLFVENDKIGVHNRLRLFGTYSYKLTLGPGDLSIGLQGGGLYYSSNLTDVEDLIDTDDPVFQENSSRFLPNFGIGLFYYTAKSFVGISVPHLLNNDILQDDISTLSAEERHYFISGGTVVDVADNVKLKPAVMLKWVPNQAPISVDLNLSFIFNQSLTLGAAHRLSESVSGFVTYQFSQSLRGGYLYDFPLIDLPGLIGSHELFLGYEFGFPDERIVSPRFF